MTAARADALPPASPLDQDFSRPGRKPGGRSGWRLVRGAWGLLVGLKDFLVLGARRLFFGLIFAALNARPGTPAKSRSIRWAARCSPGRAAISFTIRG